MIPCTLGKGAFVGPGAAWREPPLAEAKPAGGARSERRGGPGFFLSYPMLFIPANNPIPEAEDGGLDWPGVTEIEIIGIVDTH